MKLLFVTLAVAGMGSVVAALAQAPAPAPAQPAAPPPPMTFFVTSTPLDGGNLGGLAGADRHCQQLAEAAGSTGKTWRAYLSTQGAGAVNARDRIGQGPWHNAKGRMIAKSLSELHGDTLEEARNGNLICKMTALTETGAEVNGVGDTPNLHDILTGTRLDGTAFPPGEDRTCGNWTSNSTGAAQVGHHDRNSSSSISWNSAHPSRACDMASLARSGGGGLFYCFAID
jgi:hypothetical protein